MFRCPTCIAVLAEPRARRCDTCGQNLRRRHPLVLGDTDRLNSHRLPIDRFMAKRAKLHLPPALRAVPPAAAEAPIAAAATPPPSPAHEIIKRVPRRMPAPAPPVRPAPVVAAAPVVPAPPVEHPIVDDFTPDRRRKRARAKAAEPVVAMPIAEAEPVKRVLLFDLIACEAAEAAAKAEANKLAQASIAVAPEAPAPVAAPEPVAATAPEPVVAAEPVVERRRAVASPPAAREEAERALSNPALDMIERYTLAIAREPVREIDPDIEAALDDLARTAREEILANNGPKKSRHDPDTPWLAPIRKAWEPPDPEELAPRSRWAFRRRVS